MSIFPKPDEPLLAHDKEVTYEEFKNTFVPKSFHGFLDKTLKGPIEFWAKQFNSANKSFDKAHDRFYDFLIDETPVGDILISSFGLGEPVKKTRSAAHLKEVSTEGRDDAMTKLWQDVINALSDPQSKDTDKVIGFLRESMNNTDKYLQPMLTHFQNVYNKLDKVIYNFDPDDSTNVATVRAYKDDVLGKMQNQQKINNFQLKAGIFQFLTSGGQNSQLLADATKNISTTKLIFDKVKTSFDIVLDPNASYDARRASIQNVMEGLLPQNYGQEKISAIGTLGYIGQALPGIGADLIAGRTPTDVAKINQLLMAMPNGNMIPEHLQKLAFSTYFTQIQGLDKKDKEKFDKKNPRLKGLIDMIISGYVSPEGLRQGEENDINKLWGQLLAPPD